MRPTFRKLEVKDIGDLERLVTENVEGIEPGLKVIDSRLLLGDAAIDIVALDAEASLVLIALDFTADEGLLLRVMDAYSWCLEYPDTVRRLYLMAQVSSGRPPRIVFIVERLTDSFMRRIKQLSFLEIDCLEFRHLEVNGTSALYFDLVQRLRKSEAGKTTVAPAPQAPVIAPPRPVVEPASPVVEPAPIPVAETPAAAAAAPEMFAPEPAPSLDLGAASLLAALRAVEVPQDQAEAVEEPQGKDAEQPVLELEAVPPVVEASPNQEWQALLSQLGVEMPVRPSPDDAAPSVPEAAPVIAAAQEAVATAPPPVAAAVTETPKAPAPPAPPPPAWAKPTEKAVPPSAGRTYFFAQAVKGPASAEPKAAPAAPAVPAAPAPAAPGAPASATEGSAPGRPELDSLNFPKDGLSRQWLEFLNQLSAAK